MSCGTCTLCCTLMGVDELKKPPCTKCVHEVRKCTIYHFRPQSCKDFECLWLTSQSTSAPWPKSMRPDKAGGFFVASNELDTLALRVNHAPGSVPSEKLLKYTDRFILAGATVVVTRGDRMKTYRKTEPEKPLPNDPI